MEGNVIDTGSPTWFLVAAAFGIALVWCYWPVRPENKQPVSVNEIFNEMHNERLTDRQLAPRLRRYKGREIEVRGKLSDVYNGFFGGFRVAIRTERSEDEFRYNSVWASLSRREKPFVDSLRKGDELAVVGVVRNCEHRSIDIKRARLVVEPLADKGKTPQT